MQKIVAHPKISWFGHFQVGLSDQYRGDNQTLVEHWDGARL